MTKINDKNYWDNRFETNWETYSGPEQTSFFCDIALKNLPDWLINEFKNNSLSLCDIGCAEGQCVEIFSKKFKKIKTEGVDFSEIAINKAKKKYPNLQFRVEDINELSKSYDVIYCSNTLEHFENPKDKLEKLLTKTKKHLILQIPFQEKNKFKEHLSRFDFDSFNLQEKDFYLSFFRVTDTSNLPNTFWPGKQLILIYSNIKNTDLTKIHAYSTINKKEINDLLMSSIILEQKNKLVKDIELLNKRIDQEEEQITEYSQTLNKIYNSKTWKILGLYKKISLYIKKIVKKVLPIKLRKQIKATISAKLFNNPKINISKDILEELHNYKRNEDSIDLINFSVISWDFRYQRPQQLATHIATKNNRVFYIENEFLPYKHSNDIFAPIKIVKKTKNVYAITLSASRNLFIYNETPSESDKKIILASIKTLLYKANIVNPVAKIDHPFWANILNDIAMPSVYDCMDNHQGFNENGTNNIDLEQKLFTESDITIVTSTYLERLAQNKQAKNISLIKNAGDYNHFETASHCAFDTPDDLKNISHPIIGYYGAIAEWFDTEILEDIAKKNSDHSFVLIGNVTNSKVEKLANKYKNIHLLGEKPYDLLPAYLQHFDVCIIPFILNELIKATHPVKIFEYFAAGKPVVTTEMPEILEFKDNIYFGNKTNFSNQIKQAIKNKDKNTKDRQLIAQNNTWDKRAEELLDIIKNNIFPKTSIVLLTYNNPEMTRNTINSILNRTFFPNYELIIVDNNSDSETKKIIKEYSKNKKVKIIFNKNNYGFAKGNNIGLNEAIGDYIILLNNDVLITPGWITRLIFYCKKNNVGLVGPVTNSIGNEAKIDIDYDPKNQKKLESKAREYTSANWGKSLELGNIAAFCWIMSKNTYQSIGGLDERFGRGLFEDDDYCHRVKLANLTILCARDIFIHHFGGASFKKIETDEYKKIFENNKKLFENKWNITWQKHHYLSKQ